MFCVVKLGGSHLVKSDWPARLVDWCHQNDLRQVFLIVGGGEAIEAMRELDRVHNLDQTQMHWRCVRMLRATAEIATELLTRTNIPWQVDLLDDETKLTNMSVETLGNDRRITVVDVNAFYHPGLAEELGNHTHYLPALGWNTTSDAIAIYLARLIQADACYLLKSCVIEPGLTLERAAELHIVDFEAPRMACEYRRVHLIQL